MRDWGMLYDRPPMVLKMDGPLDEEAKMVPQIRKYVPEYVIEILKFTW